MAPPGGVVEHSTDKEMIKLSVGQTIAVTFSLIMNKKKNCFRLDVRCLHYFRFRFRSFNEVRLY